MTSVLQRLSVAVLPVIAVALAGNIVTMPAVPTWYAGLEKPSFSPPNWLFGPVWTALYAMMAYAAWRILSLPPGIQGRRTALILFFVQLALNSAWSFAFFGFKSPFAALCVILALIAAIVATMMRFFALDRIAGILFLPYLAWVLFATTLNGAIWRLNGP